jgi:hypothetical protein
MKELSTTGSTCAVRALLERRSPLVMPVKKPSPPGVRRRIEGERAGGGDLVLGAPPPVPPAAHPAHAPTPLVVVVVVVVVVEPCPVDDDDVRR